MIFMHVKCLKFHICFTFGVKGSEVVLKFHDEKIEIQKPNGVIQAQKYGFKTVQCDPLQVGKGIVDLVFFSSEKILVIPKIQLALKYESTEFLGSEPLNGLGSLSLGLDVKVWDWMSLSMAMANLLASAFSWVVAMSGVSSGCFIISGVGVERFRWCRWVCRLVCSQHGYRCGQMWRSLSSWARVSRKVKDGVGIFKSCCYSGISGKVLGHMMSRR